MTQVTFFNRHPPNTTLSKEAVLALIGQEAPLIKNGEQIGFAKVLTAFADEQGLHIRYETEADLGLMIELPIEPIDFKIPI